MRSFLRWVVLAAFSAGLCVNFAQRWRTVLGLSGFLVSFLGMLLNLCADSPRTSESCPVDVHETVVLESFAQLTPHEAAALLGILQEYRIVPANGDGTWVEALTLHSAVDLVARVTGLPREQLRGLYRDHWVDLRRTTAPRLMALLASHPRVLSLLPVSES